MAFTAEHSRQVRGRGTADPVTPDRERDFRRARRHSALVATMRYALPLAAVASAGVYGAVVLQRSGWGTATTADTPAPIAADNLTMKDPHYDGFNSDGGRYTVRALTAEQDMKNPKVIRLNGITGELLDAKGTRTDLKARRGTFDSQSNLLDLHDEIDIVTTDGMRAKLRSARIGIKDNLVTSSEPVEVQMTAGAVRANEMALQHKLRQVSFAGEVTTHLNAPDGAGATKVRAASGPARPFGASDQPVDITSDRLDVDDAAKRAVFSGRVRAEQAGATLESPALDVTYSGAAPGMPGAAEGQQPADEDTTSQGIARQGKVQRIIARGPVVMTQATGDRVTSDSADFDAEHSKAVLEGQVVMTQAPDRRASSNRAEIDQRAEAVLLLGDVVVNQGKNELRGQRLTSDRKAGRTRLTAAPADGGKGRIFARFFRGGASPAAAASAPAASANPLGATFKTDPSAPVDVDADTLDINDQRKAAVFSGNVQAVQGAFKLRTAELTAYYTGEAGLGGAGSPAAKDAAAKPAADLQRIEARRSVVVQSQDGQTATGDWADYDTKRNTVTLGGDVVLTRGVNVVRGSRLVIDMATGRSVIETDPTAAWSARAQPAQAAGGKGPSIDVPAVGGRPSAVFYPKALKDKSATGGGATQPSGQAGAWASGARGPAARPANQDGN